MDSMPIDSAPTGDSTADAGTGTGGAPSDVTPTAATIRSLSGGMSHFAQSLKLEHQFLRVPIEHLKKTIRASHRVVDKELTAVIASVAEAADRDEPMSRDDAVAHLSSLVTRLQGLKLKSEEGSKEESLQAQRCRARLEHLDAAAHENLPEWGDIRLKRIIVDYMLRMSYYDTAKKLAEDSNIQDLVDIDVFLDAKKIIDSLRNKEVAPALAWCSENRARLKKSKSTLEFWLRHQEFIELVRAGEKLTAIEYARRYLAPWASTNIKDLQRALTILAFQPNTGMDTYKVLFEPTRWDYLVEHFMQEFCSLFGMTRESLLSIYLQAGLTVIKTQFCYEGGCPKEDPLSQESFMKLAEPLPFCIHEHSKLICYITRELMDHENPPMVLPNGYVYSTKALEEMARNNAGIIICPRTGYICGYTDLVQAYI